MGSVSQGTQTNEVIISSIPRDTPTMSKLLSPTAIYAQFLGQGSTTSASGKHSKSFAQQESSISTASQGIRSRQENALRTANAGQSSYNDYCRSEISAQIRNLPGSFNQSSHGSHKTSTSRSQMQSRHSSYCGDSQFRRHLDKSVAKVERDLRRY